MRIQLKDGNLYESVDGDRFRVTYNRKTHRFECKACGKEWLVDGTPTEGHSSTVYVGNWLVREIPEMRWVTVGAYGIDDLESGEIYKTKGRHVFKQVTREQARRMAPNYVPPGVEYTKHASATLWHGAKSELIERDGKRFIRVVTGQGKTVEIEV